MELLKKQLLFKPKYIKLSANVCIVELDLESMTSIPSVCARMHLATSTAAIILSNVEHRITTCQKLSEWQGKHSNIVETPTMHLT